MAFWSRRRRQPFPTDHDAEATELAAEAMLTTELDRLDAVDPERAVRTVNAESAGRPLQLRASTRRDAARIVPWRERLRDAPATGLETHAGATHVAGDG